MLTSDTESGLIQSILLRCELDRLHKLCVILFKKVEKCESNPPTRRDLTPAEDVLHAKNEEICRLNAALDAKNTECQGFELRISELDAALARIQANYPVPCENERNLRDRIKQLELERSTLYSENCVLTQKVDCFSKFIEEKAINTKCKEATSSLISHVMQLIDTNNALNAALAEYSSSTTDKDKNSNNNNHNNSKQQQSTTGEISAFSPSITTLNRSDTSKKSLINDALILESLKDQLASQERVINVLTNQLSIKNEEIHRLRTKYTEESQEHLEAILEEASNTEKLIQTKLSLEQENLSLKEKVDSLQSLIEQNETVHTDWKGRIEAKQQEIGRLQQELSEIVALRVSEKQSYEGQIAELCAQVMEFKKCVLPENRKYIDQLEKVKLDLVEEINKRDQEIISMQIELQTLRDVGRMTPRGNVNPILFSASAASAGGKDSVLKEENQRLKYLLEEKERSLCRLEQLLAEERRERLLANERLFDSEIQEATQIFLFGNEIERLHLIRRDLIDVIDGVASEKEELEKELRLVSIQNLQNIQNVDNQENQGNYGQSGQKCRNISKLLMTPPVNIHISANNSAENMEILSERSKF